MAIKELTYRYGRARLILMLSETAEWFRDHPRRLRYKLKKTNTLKKTTGRQKLPNFTSALLVQPCRQLLKPYRKLKCSCLHLPGNSFDYPVSSTWRKRSEIESQGRFLPEIKSFCDRLEAAAGYFAGFYTLASFAGSVVTGRFVRKRYCYWCAQWADACSYEDSCGIWQHSPMAPFPASMAVDMDWSYQDFPTVIIGGGFNGYQNQLTILLPRRFKNCWWAGAWSARWELGQRRRSEEPPSPPPVMIMIPCSPRWTSYAASIINLSLFIIPWNQAIRSLPSPASTVQLFLSSPWTAHWFKMSIWFWSAGRSEWNNHHPVSRPRVFLFGIPAGFLFSSAQITCSSPVGNWRWISYDRQ